MARFRFFSKMVSAPPEEAAFASAQLAATARLMPIMFATLVLSAAATAYTHHAVAPAGLTFYPLAALTLLCALRTVHWIRIGRRPPSGREAVRQLRHVGVFALVLGAGFAGWGVLLAGYGDEAAAMQVLFFLTIMMMVCVYCLRHLRPSARIVCAIACPITLYFASRGSTMMSVTAMNYAGVIAALAYLQSIGFRDFRQRVRLIEENRALAHTDTLTGLPNRRSFFAKLQETLDGHALDRAGAASRDLAVAVIDLDGFKPVNDGFGHRAGDAVLREVARRLGEAMAGRGSAARLGGDEFGLIVEGACDLDALGQALCASLGASYDLREGTAQVGASIGFARLEPGAPIDAETLVERADCALYHAKACARGTALCFAPEHDARRRSHAVIEQALRRADFEAEFALAYQPIVDVAQLRVNTYEALARWQSPDLGNVSPADFILVAERTGLIRPLTRVLLGKALRALATWPEDARLSFNLSAQDITTPECIDRITALVCESGVDLRRITFEITETGLMRDIAAARRSLLALRELGVGIALDDFGTGYSSLSHVHQLPITTLKVDRSFVVALGANTASLNIVRAIFDLCRNLDLCCVVEGVETLEQMLLLRSAGCRYMQGYLFRRPLQEAEVEAFHRAPLTIGRDGTRTWLSAAA